MDNPTPPNSPAWTLSINLPAKGAAIMVASGQGVSNNPVITSSNSKVCCKKKGKETIANICATKELTDVPTDKENIGILKRSTGNKGYSWDN